MSVIKRILVGMAVIIGILVLGSFLLPRVAQVERTAIVKAPQATVFALLNGYGRFNEWSPWFQRDPVAEYTIEGPEFGEGAELSWNSANPKVGSGSQTIVESESYNLIRAHLDFGDEGTAETFFRLEPVTKGTRVTWGFETDFGSNPLNRYFGLMFDRWIGADYEKGLTNLAQLVESLPKADWSDIDIEIVEVDAGKVAATSGSVVPDQQSIAQALAAAYGLVTQVMARNGLEQTGPPVAITKSWDDKAWHFEAGIPVASTSELNTGHGSAVKVKRTYGGKAVRAVHVGPYSEISSTWEKVSAFMAAHGLEKGDDPWEEYVSDPESSPEEELITHVCYPVK